MVAIWAGALDHHPIARFELMCGEELADPSALTEDLLVTSNIRKHWLSDARVHLEELRRALDVGATAHGRDGEQLHDAGEVEVIVVQVALRELNGSVAQILPLSSNA